MKRRKMELGLVLVLSILMNMNGQTIYYSQQSGDPTVLTNWNTSRTGVGTNPSNFTTNNQYYIIQNGHSMNPTTSRWTISGGSGVRLQIESGGVLQSDSAVDLTSTGNFQIDDGGTYIHNNTQTPGTTIFDGIESFGALSTVQINQWVGTGISLTTRVTLPFGNLFINWTTNSGDWQWSLATGAVNLCTGNLTISSTGTGSLILCSSSSPIVSITGNLDLTSGTMNMSNGSGNSVINLHGNLSMNGSTITETSSGSGTIAFSGSSLQSYTNTAGSILNKINITLDNGSGLQLNNPLSLNGGATLTMSNGNINLNGNPIVLGEGTGSTQVASLSWTSGFITGSGSLKRWFQNSTTIAKGDVAGLFPFGDGSDNRNLWIGCVTSSSGGGTLTVQYNPASGTTSISSFVDAGISIDLRTNASWAVTVADGLSGGYNFGIRIQASNFPGILSYSDLRLIRATDTVGVAESSTGTNTNPQVNRIGLDNSRLSNTFYFGANSAGNPLPVELTSFSAAIKNNSILLTWQTATEVNNYGFEIERQAHPNPSQREGLFTSPLWGAWGAVGFVNGAGNSNSTKEYSFTDKSATSGKYTYRLKQIDNDGKYEYSKEVEVDLGTPTAFALEQNYPNPFNPTTSIQYSVVGSQNVTIKVFNVLGKEVAVLVSEKQEPGTYTVEFATTGLASGTYIYRMQAGEFVQTKKMVLLK